MKKIAIVLILANLVSIVSLAQNGYFKVSGPDFLERTNFIFVGTLLDQASFRSPDGRYILTRHIFRVEDAVKGKPGTTIEIMEYGGTLGNKSMTVSHSASYQEGGKYLVFSHPRSTAGNRTFAGPLGRFPVLTDEKGNRTVRIYSSHPLLEVLEREEAGILQDLGQFSRQIRSQVERRSGETQ